MRVAVLAHSFPRFPGDTHGPFVKRLSEELARLGHEMHVLVPFDPELRDDPASPLTLHSFRYVKPDRWHRLGYSRTLKRDVGMKIASWVQAPLYFSCAARALARLVRERGIELVHAHWILPNGYVARRATRGAEDVPYVCTLHGSDVFMAERNPLFRRMAARALSGARHVTSCSPDLRDRLLALSGDPEQAAKVSLVANGTDLPPPGFADSAARRRLETELGLPPDTRLVVAVGRMVDKKGFDVLLDAAPKILDGRDDVRLVLGGGGDLLPALRARARSLGGGADPDLAERILFPGPLSHDRVLRLLAVAEVVAMPSVRDRRGNVDGLPVVVLEAMAAGRPVVASRLAGIPLAVEDGATGLLVPERDPRALGQAVAALLDKPATARAMGAAGRSRVERELTWSAIARVHDRIYRRTATGG